MHDLIILSARLGAIVVLVAAVLVTGVPVAAAAPGGSISGTVVSAADGTPLADVCVNVEGTKLSVLTDGKGAYSVDGLDAGTYTLRYTDCGTSPAYVEQWYLGHADSGKTDAVVVVDGEDTALKTVKLEALKSSDPVTPEKPSEVELEAEPGMQVSGTVTDSGGTPLDGISVNLYSNTGGPGTGTVTAPDGTYLTDELAPGDYRVEFAGGSFAREYWKDQYTPNTANLVTLGTGPGVVSDINASLTDAATIAGTVTDQGGLPVGGVCVSAFLGVNGGEWVNGANTEPDGTYSIPGLPATDLRVRFEPCATPYVEQWYAGARWFDESTPIVLAESEVRTGIDAQLAAGITISGHVADTGGAPIAGINVNVNSDGPGSGAWAQTGVDGNYTTSALAPGNYRVQFYDGAPAPTWATQYWNGRQTWNQATILTVAASDAPNRAGIDAVLTQAVTITGTVTRPDGDPAQNVCVNAVIDTPDGLDGVGYANVESDGTYAMTGLPATPMRVVFQDCNNVGPWVTQWWDNQPTPEAATIITPLAGQTIAGVDAHFAPAAQIRGHVTDTSDTPLEGICAQATSSGWVGGLTQTNSSGDYAITVSRAGTYKVQFVDCSDVPKFAGEWWDDAATVADATPVTLATGGIVDGVDAALALGGPATVSGNVHDLTGAPMTAACVVVYLPNQFALFAPVQADGSYEVPNVPSGTYALAALGCGEGEEPSPVVPISGVTGVAYSAMWWGGVPLDLVQGTDGGPDPIAQGATLVTIEPDAALTGYDFCFGCAAIDVTGVRPTTDSVSIDFDTPGLIDLTGDPESGASSAAVSAADVAVPLVYAAACTSAAGATTSATTVGVGSITLTGLAPRSAYTCQITASDGSILVAGSTAFAAVTLGVPGDPASGANDAPAALAFTGSSSSVPLVLVALTLLVLGLVALAVARRVRTNA